MYCLEGELVVRRNPETLLGQYGCLYVADQQVMGSSGELATHRHSIVRTGDEDYVLTARELLIEAGKMPGDTPIEEITSVEQAEKYISPAKQRLFVARHRLPILGELLDGSVTDDQELLEGTARLWKDRCFPTPYVYLLARGALLAEVEYDQDQGWHHAHDEVEGSRTVRGVVIPIAHKTTTQYQTKGKTRRGYNFTETTRQGTSRSKGYQVGFSFHLQLGKKPEPEAPTQHSPIEEGSVLRSHEGETFVVTGFSIIADQWEKKRKLAAGIKYQRLDEAGEPIGDEYTRPKREVLHGTTKYDGKLVPLFTLLAEQ